jgi:hypothetical protein
MRLFITALALTLLAAGVPGAFADPTASSGDQVQSPHGGYNVIQGGARPSGNALFGPGGLFSTPAPNSGDQVQNPHGGYNVIQGGNKPSSIAVFGSGGFLAQAKTHPHDKPSFILRPAGFEDNGHGGKIAIYKKIYYATPEEAEAAKGQ